MQVLQTSGALPPGAGGLPGQGVSPQMALPPPPGANYAATSDFWDVGDNSFVGQQLPPDHEFSEMVVEQPRSRGRPLVLLLLLIILAAVGWGAYEFFVEEKDPFNELMTLVMNLMGESVTPVDDAPVPHHRKPKAQPAPVAAPKPAGKLLQPVAGNPYWALPNKLLGAHMPLGRLWTPEEEETFRAGLTHRYTYQRWKTVQDVRRMRLQGSDVILWDALQDKKLWTRMFAVVGLAEFNIEVTPQALESAMAKARSELLANFFERFVKNASPAQLFVMRQAVRLLDERGRLVCLRAIHRSHDALRDVYMAAATQDPGRHVQAWAKQALAERPMNPDRYNDLIEVVQGKATDDIILAGVHSGPSASQPKTVPASGVATEEDLDKQLEQSLGDEGDVEFYDTSGSLQEEGDKPDPETFEYQD